MRAILPVGLCVLVVACGGSLSNPPEDGGTDSGTGQDSSSDGGQPYDGWSPTGCPPAPPSQGGACSPEQIECEYGTNPSPDCNQLFKCMNGTWQDQSSGTICAPQTDCPPSYASITQGGTCSPKGLGCAYPQGTCFCGGTLQVQNPTWGCGDATSTCPSPRPDIGTACSEPDQTCDYSGCSGGATLQCKDGVWTQVFTPCPG